MNLWYTVGMENKLLQIPYGVSSWTCTKGRVMLVGNTVYYAPAAGVMVIFM